MNKFFLFLVLALTAVAAIATPTADDLQRLELELQQANRTEEQSKKKSILLSDEIKEVKQQMIQSAKAVQEQEDSLSQLEDNLAKLSAREKVLEEELHLTDMHLVKLITAMQNMALRPKEMFFLKAGNGIDMVRAQLLLKQMVPVISSVENQLQTDLTELLQTKQEVAKKLNEIKVATDNLSQKNQQIKRLMLQKTLLQAQYNATHQQAKKKSIELASRAKDLKELLEQLELEKKRQQMLAKQAEKAKPNFTPTPSVAPADNAFEKSYGSLIYPARGKVVQNFGDATASGAHVKGLTLATRTKAQVTAPFDGVVLFAGQFKNYGQLLIIDNGNNYLTLLAGLGAINVGVGQEVLTGEPVGNMTATEPHLYIEIRKQGQAIDPRPWFIPQT